nr:GFA family protein [Tianweitania sediminis]
MTECWCSDCQKETGGGSSHSVIVSSDDVEIVGEQLGTRTRRSQRGAEVTRSFCLGCGNTIKAAVGDTPFIGLRAGLFDDRAFFRPQMVLFASEAPAWVSFPAGAKLFDSQPSAAA